MPRALLALLALLTACAPQGPPAPDFTLTDQHGASWSLAAQHGRGIALFFGYTHCADTCPATLAKLETALAGKPNAEIAFVTVDPRRDTPPVLARYLSRFARVPVAGLTGTTAAIDAVEKRYHVWAQRVPGPRGGLQYDEAHTAMVFLIDRDGRMSMTFDDSDTVAGMSAAIRKAL